MISSSAIKRSKNHLRFFYCLYRINLGTNIHKKPGKSHISQSQSNRWLWLFAYTTHSPQSVPDRAFHCQNNKGMDTKETLPKTCWKLLLRHGRLSVAELRQRQIIPKNSIKERKKAYICASLLGHTILKTWEVPFSVKVANFITTRKAQVTHFNSGLLVYACIGVWRHLTENRQAAHFSLCKILWLLKL